MNPALLNLHWVRVAYGECYVQGDPDPYCQLGSADLVNPCWVKQYHNH